MGKLTTHVLDTSRGVPAANVETRLYRLAALGGEGRELVLKTRTNADGRCDSPLLADDSMQEGTYELEFEAGHYFDSGMEKQGAKGAGPRFLDCVIIRFGIDDPGSHYHVPLLISPFGYSTYRGS